MLQPLMDGLNNNPSRVLHTCPHVDKFILSTPLRSGNTGGMSDSDLRKFIKCGSEEQTHRDCSTRYVPASPSAAVPALPGAAAVEQLGELRGMSGLMPSSGLGSIDTLLGVPLASLQDCDMGMQDVWGYSYQDLS